VSASLVVVTDLDGCLLDADTYSWDAARPALAELVRTHTPLVLCSGKTRAEMEALQRDLGLAVPFIVENGGAIVFPEGSYEGEVPRARAEGGARVLVLGTPRTRIVRQLRELAALTDVKARGFGDMDVAEVVRLTGLASDAARLAMQREFDEPFLVGDGTAVDGLARAAAARGLQLRHGGRFFHLTGGCDKGLAVRALLALYRRDGMSPTSVGLGDAETDLPLLRAVDRPVVVPSRDGTPHAVLAAHLPGAEQAPGPGPGGWNEAVLALLAGHALPRVAEAGGAPRC
jgi:mannosyl-3-phosphoglycerate phosphatase